MNTPLVLGQAGCQLLEHLAVVVVQPCDLLLVQHAGHDGRSSDGHKGEGTEGKEGAVLVVGLMVALDLVLDADAHLAGFIHAGLVGNDHTRAHQGGVASTSKKPLRCKTA